MLLKLNPAEPLLGNSVHQAFEIGILRSEGTAKHELPAKQTREGPQGGLVQRCLQTPSQHTGHWKATISPRRLDPVACRRQQLTGSPPVVKAVVRVVHDTTLAVAELSSQEPKPLL